MTKEQILTAITQAVSTGEITDVDTGFVRTIKTINGLPLKFFVGAQSEYDELSTADKQNLFAIITNDTTKEGLQTAIEELQNAVKGVKTRVNNIENGATVVENAKNAKNANYATEALKATSVIGEQLSTSILAKVITLNDGIYDYRLSGDTYTGDDMPHDHAKYSTATVFKRGTGAVVMLWGYSNIPTYRNVYDGTSWEGWQEIITSATVKKYKQCDIVFNITTDVEWVNIVYYSSGVAKTLQRYNGGDVVNEFTMTATNVDVGSMLYFSVTDVDLAEANVLDLPAVERAGTVDQYTDEEFNLREYVKCFNVVGGGNAYIDISQKG